MAKFNTRESVNEIENEVIASSVVDHKDFTLNYEGGVAYNLNKYTELYTRVASCLVNEPKFYEKKGTTEKAILKLVQEISKENPEFILKLAVYARQHLYLRSIPTLLLAECSLINECKKYVRAYTPDIVRRADELKEVIAYLIGKIGQIGDGNSGTSKVKNAVGKGSLPAGLKKGLADAFSNFNAYQLAKYDSRDDVVKLRDVLRLTHPKPQTDLQSQWFKQLISGTLPVPETWETIISGKGSTKENWEHAATVMPIMALIRNLRNLLQHDIGNWDIVKQKLTDPVVIQNSKQFPFRFLSAYREIEQENDINTRYVMEWLEQAIDLSVVNIPEYDGITAVFADNSASMDNHLSRGSGSRRGRSQTPVTLKDIANVFLAAIDKRSERAVCGIFGDYFALKNFPLRNGILQNARSIKYGEVGGSTNAYLVFEYLLSHKVKVDRIIVLTDEQCYDSNNGWYGVGASLYEGLLKYKRNINPNVFSYTIDVGGYGTTQFPEDEPNTAVFAGFSDKILNFIKTFEEDKTTAITTINNIKPRGRKILAINKVKTDNVVDKTIEHESDSDE